MSGIFSKPKSVEAPPVVATPPIPTGVDEAGDAEVKKAMRKSGRDKTILAGNLEPMNSGKKTILG